MTASFFILIYVVKIEMGNSLDLREKYRLKLTKYDNNFLSDFDKNSREQRQYKDLQPSVDPQSGHLLSFLVRLIGAKRVLEFGTSIGYSSIWLASALKESGGKLITVDNHPRTSIEAKQNFSSSGLDSFINFKNEDAQSVIEYVKPPFDLIFMDCGKSLYPKFLDKFHFLLRKGGVLAVDDTLFPVEVGVRENLVKYVEEFNLMLKNDSRFYCVTLDIGHGLTLAYKV